MWPFSPQTPFQITAHTIAHRQTIEINKIYDFYHLHFFRSIVCKKARRESNWSNAQGFPFLYPIQWHIIWMSSDVIHIAYATNFFLIRLVRIKWIGFRFAIKIHAIFCNFFNHSLLLFRYDCMSAAITLLLTCNYGLIFLFSAIVVTTLTFSRFHLFFIFSMWISHKKKSIFNNSLRISHRISKL